MLAAEAANKITNLYRILLAREPDAAGLRYYVDSILNGQSYAQVEAVIANLPEVKIRGVYLRQLGREPDQSGLSYYMNQLNSGRSLSVIDYEISVSPEAQNQGRF